MLHKLRRGGFNPTANSVDLHAKISLPFVSLVVTLLAIPTAFRSRSGGSIVASLGASLSPGFAYWIIISIGISLGHAGKLPPFPATWMPNLFFTYLAGHFWIYLDR